MVSAFDANVANWICPVLSITILCVRLGITRFRDKKFNLTSGVVVASIAALVARIIVVYFYLRFGTSNDALSGKKPYFNASDIRLIEIGSILIVVSRALVTTFYWLQISLLLLFYSALVREFHWRNTINICWGLIAASYVAVILASVLECRPFNLYWRIDPPPGECVHAYTQLYMQGISNIVLDLVLLAISYPLLRVRNRTWPQTLRVGALFILGCFTMIVASVRISYIHGMSSYAPVRSFWASIQILTSTFVANAPTIYGCWQVMRRRKTEQRTRRASRPELWAPLGESPSHSHQGPVMASATTLATANGAMDDDEKAWADHFP